jgi:hypothetical protein
MNPEIFAEWLSLQGHKVYRSKGSLWVQAGPRILQAIPYHHVIDPPFDELNELLIQNGAIGLRYSTPWNAHDGMISYHVTFTRHEYPLSSLPQKARHDVRRGMSAACIEPIAFARLAGEGWRLRFDTLQRQGRVGAETPQCWQRLCQSAEGLAGFETWAAIVKGQLAASLIAFTSGDCCSILYQQSRTEYLPLGVNNALIFVFTNEILKRPGPRWMFYGLQSLDAPPSVDEFKFRMGYTAKPVRQRVMFHPWFRPFLNRASHAILRAGQRILPGNAMVSKAEGMFRFFLQGKMPLSEQTKPAPLREAVCSDSSWK